ncbi:MAG TPA: molybdopterin molybdotransferase MoeA, partial [Arenibacter sp.]|nr:molybdopterin molybdotransferase MoeA [Arenibacter sp.]
MISFKAAYQKVLDHRQDYGKEDVPIKAAMGRVLAEDIRADRNFPPFNRATKDGIAIDYTAITAGRTTFKIEGLLPAGTAPRLLADTSHCVEIMTGAVVPANADTVIMYEHLLIGDGRASLSRIPIRGQEIHLEGSDKKRGDLVLPRDIKITAAEIGILATVGKALVPVKKLPKTAVVSTGNELVEITENPLPYQIRRSNIHTLYGALSEEGIVPNEFHLADNKEAMREKLPPILRDHNTVLLSGGISKGKYDFVPEILEELGVTKIFHQVSQQPGKPFWFGIQKETGTIVFSFPGNPVSSFVNYLVYFKDWLKSSMALPIPKIHVILAEDISHMGDLTLFLRVKITNH